MGNIGKKINVNDKEKQAYAFYLSKGWSPLQSAAIVGNLLHESGLNPSSEGDIGYKGGSSRGIAQFRGDRLKRLKTQYGDNWTDFGNQLEFVNWELNNTHKSAGDALKKSNDIYDAGRIVSDKYEIPAVKFNANKDRQKKVFNVYNKLSGVASDYGKYIPNPRGVSTDVSQGAFDLVAAPNFIPENEVVDIPSEVKDTEAEIKAKEDIAKVTNEQQILQDYFSSITQTQQLAEQPQLVPEVEQFPNLVDQYAQVSQFVDNTVAQEGGATRQDSINIRNSSLKFKNKIKELGYKKRDELNKFSPKDKNNLYIFKDGEIQVNRNVQDKEELKENTNTRKNGDVYLNSNVNRTGGKNDKPETVGYNHPVLRRINKNQYETTEQTSFLGYNTELPTIIMDGRIKPQNKNQYDLKGGERNPDYVVFNEYDPIAVTPFDMLTESQKRDRVKRYGTSGVPKSYIDGVNISNKDISIPDLKVLNSLKQQGLIKFSEDISSNINIPNQYIQPKYWDVVDKVNQKFGGYRESYRVYPNTANTMLRELAPEPYNSRVSTPYYQSGGTIGNLTTEQVSDVEKQREWLNYWNSDRVIDGKRINNDSSNIPFSSDIYIDDLNSDNNREVTLGEFDNVSNRLILDTNYQSKPGIPVHEFSHRYQKYLNPDIYNKYINQPISQALQQTQGSSEYHGNVDENQAELNRLRYNSGFKPDQVITPQDLQKYKSEDYNLKHFSEDQLINLLNSTAYTSSNEATYAQQGGKIPVSSNGVYDFPMREVIVPTKNGNITMANINYPIIGIDEYGNKQLMMPGQDYKFPGKTIHEIPQLQQYFNKR